RKAEAIDPKAAARVAAGKSATVPVRVPAEMLNPLICAKPGKQQIFPIGALVFALRNGKARLSWRFCIHR
ncbi:MAG: hypothetical protein WA662_15430, partial [Pseudolabrys sp.]